MVPPPNPDMHGGSDVQDLYGGSYQVGQGGGRFLERAAEAKDSWNRWCGKDAECVRGRAAIVDRVLPSCRRRWKQRLKQQSKLLRWTGV